MKIRKKSLVSHGFSHYPCSVFNSSTGRSRKDLVDEMEKTGATAALKESKDPRMPEVHHLDLICKALQLESKQ